MKLIILNLLLALIMSLTASAQNLEVELQNLISDIQTSVSKKKYLKKDKINKLNAINQFLEIAVNLIDPNHFEAPCKTHRKNIRLDFLNNTIWDLQILISTHAQDFSSEEFKNLKTILSNTLIHIKDKKKSFTCENILMGPGCETFFTQTGVYKYTNLTDGYGKKVTNGKVNDLNITKIEKKADGYTHLNGKLGGYYPITSAKFKGENIIFNTTKNDGSGITLNGQGVCKDNKVFVTLYSSYWKVDIDYVFMK